MGAKSIVEIIRERYSCRRYLDRPIATDIQQSLITFLDSHQIGPCGSRIRFSLVAATEDNRQSLKGVGTYGVIRGAQGFIVGAMRAGDKNLEDFGYLMEHAVLTVTGLGLGSCWLGGSFTKSSFAKRIAASSEEKIPAVTSIGYIADSGKGNSWISRQVGSTNRLPPDKLFFQDSLDTPLSLTSGSTFNTVLESVRLAPSASNKQPWRIVRKDGYWHFYLQRTKGYGKDSLLGKLIGVADLQRVDMGIAMCHFELTARELGLSGCWELNEPAMAKPDNLTEYAASWRELN